MGLSFFFTIDGSISEKILKILCLIVWGIGGCVYLYGAYETIFSTILFPEGTQLVTSNWLMHISLRFFVLWVPMGFALNQWQMKKPLIFPALYILGCLFAILLSFIALVQVLTYVDNESMFMTEYSDIIMDQIKGDFPPYVLRVLRAYGCCGWHGPTDFGPKMMIDIGDKVDTNAKFMRGVAECYGKTFEITSSSNSKPVYKPATGTQRTIPPGCGTMLVNIGERQVNFIFCMAIVVMVFSLIIVILYIINYLKMPSAQVGDVNTQRNGAELQDFQQGTRSSVDNVEDPESSVIASPST